MPLRLKSLELQGYKTFASRTLFEFSAGITAIVGPNGSGKSNIADAVRWVLGEQSYLLLRGKKTEDMIFSGSELRPRAGMAQATVTFDNSIGWLPLEYAEVELSRHAFRDGRNDYLLNGHHVRLREINEVLAQAGLSERTYTVLGQGLVDASLALRADERRRLFEEAAGVALYRSRREEALKRLDTTNHNLERVLDILSELEPRLRSLERQAKRSMEFARAQADLKAVLRDWYGYHWHRAQEELLDARATVGQAGNARREASTVSDEAQSNLQRFRERLLGQRGELNAWHRRISELQAEREAGSRGLAALAEKRGALTAGVETSQAEVERTLGELVLARERLLAAEADLRRLQAEYDDSQSELASARQLLEGRQNRRVQLEAELSSVRQEIDQSNQARAETQARLDEVLHRLDALALKVEGTREEIAVAENAVREAEAKLKAARAVRGTAEQILADLERRLEQAAVIVSGIERKQRTALAAHAELETARSGQGAQLHVLEQAEQSLAGYAEGARFLLDAARQSRLLGTRGPLSAALDVPPELETAISAALGDTLDAVLVQGDSLEQALQLLESDGSGRAALLPLNGHRSETLPKSAHPQSLGNAAALVRAPEELRQAVDLLLGQTLVVRDRSTARTLAREIPAHARVVTLHGEVFRGDGLVIAGRLSASSNLSRPRQKRELAASLADLESKWRESSKSLEGLEAELANAQTTHADLVVALAEARRKTTDAQTAEHQAELEAGTAQKHADWQRSQLDGLLTETAQAGHAHEELRHSRSGGEGRAAEAHAQLRRLNELVADLGLEELGAQVSYWSTRAAVAEQALERGKSTRGDFAREVERLEARRAELEQNAASLQARLSEIDTEQQHLRDQIASASQEYEVLRGRLEPVERELDSAEQEEARLQAADAAGRQHLANAERLLGQAQLDLARREDALNNLREKISDDFGLVMLDYAAEVSGPVPLPLEGVVEDLPVLRELPAGLEEELSRQRARLRRMGAINPEARIEFERENERHSFLKGQVEDLQNAREDLNRVLAELDDLTRRDFARTFEAVDKEFRQIFVRLFGGGSARLALTDPDDLVETGIEIEARLPGRREQGLALLSGGERSLTAIALVFALLKVSPTPVCVMDEVDAMLDEANVGRFRDLLAELSKETQFIIITHNRNTVQAADVIYGVTMGRDSTSQVISLKLDEVTEALLT